MYKYLLLVTLSIFAACQPASEEPIAEEVAAAVAVEPAASIDNSAILAAVLDSQPDEMKARYEFRNPQETIEFFGIEPGMTVLEGLPGGGWYTKILSPYLGAEGRVIGASYSLEMYSLFPFANEEFMAREEGWEAKFLIDAKQWGGESGASVEAVRFASVPDRFANSVDVAFLPRVLHNPSNFQNNGAGDHLLKILADTFKALKPGGILGVVQHEARAEMSDEFADGSHGYLKKAWLKQQIEAAGFEFVAESDINSNSKDQPTEEDTVWNLPPTYSGTGDDAEEKAAVDAVGESNRMTLKFRKP
jgi:predicted methyltransferase